MGLVKVGAVVFLSYTLGGALGNAVVTRLSQDLTRDKVNGAKWAGRAVAFVALGIVASQI